MSQSSKGESGDLASEARPPPESGAGPHLFISHATHDAAFANRLVEACERRGLKCWIAPRDVEPGTLYAEEIVRGIDECHALVLVLSVHAIASGHVGKEVERASSKRRRIIVARLDSAPLSRAFEYFLSESQWIEVRGAEPDAVAARLVAATYHRGAATARIAPPQSGRVRDDPRYRVLVAKLHLD